MLTLLCTARPKPWLLLTSLSRGSAAAHFDRLSRFEISHTHSFNNYSSNCSNINRNNGHDTVSVKGVSLWHAYLPSLWRRRRRLTVRRSEPGEGSWNVAWDARPARWLHHPDSVWLMFGLSALMDANRGCCLIDTVQVQSEGVVGGFDSTDGLGCNESVNYRVKGVTKDGNCMFRAIAHMACLGNGEEAPDEDRQLELAVELRARVVDELLKRRKEVEWSIGEDFDAYVKTIQRNGDWGGEPELLMSSHVLRTPISVFMEDANTSKLVEVAKYGKEYIKSEKNCINILFHRYGHYDILEKLEI